MEGRDQSERTRQVALNHDRSSHQPRLLLIEDDEGRVETLRGWLPAGVQLVVARSAGAAVGVVRRDAGDVYWAIMLDHDLDRHPASDSDRLLSGQDVVDALILHVSRAVPVLVHSMNATQAPVLVARLLQAGFEVTRIPYSDLNAQGLGEWLKPVLAERAEE